MIEIDHEAHEVSVEQLKGIIGDINGIPATRESVSARLSAPVTSNRVDMDKISFERNKSGIWGWRSDKLEMVRGYECKVYAASNVEFVTRTRSEHLNEQQARVNLLFVIAIHIIYVTTDLMKRFFKYSREIHVLHFKTFLALLNKNMPTLSRHSKKTFHLMTKKRQASI